MPLTEIDFNSRFAEVLGEVSGLPGSWIVAEEEHQIAARQLRPDVLLDRPGLPPCIAECKFFESTGDPVVDIEQKLGQVCSENTRYVAGEKIKIGAAVRYPEGAKNWQKSEISDRFLENGETLEWKLASLGDDGVVSEWPESGWIEGTVDDFWESVSRTALNREEVEALSGAVTRLLKSAANHMLSKLQNHTAENKRIAKMMGEPEDFESGMEIACVVWLDALLMMNELARVDKKLHPDLETVNSTNMCLTSTGKADVQRIFAEWNKVLGDNYESVFKPAKDALPWQIISWGEMSPSFDLLLQAVKEIESARLGKIANVGGEIFARVMDGQQRKNSASFYTKSQVAEFLATLVLPSVEVLPDDWKDWKLGDFACGTGSLLRAGYRRLIHFARGRCDSKEDFHRHMMEHNLCGIDISAIAAHLSATTIVSLFPVVSYDDTNIGMVKFGTEGNTAYAGSLELITDTDQANLFNQNFTSIKGKGEGASRIEAENDSFAVVLMNPPYSRTRGGQSVADLSGISDEDRKEVQKRISVIRKNTYGHGQAGLGSDFVALADAKLADRGRMGFVLPATAAFAGSWGGVRDSLVEKFSGITVIFFADGMRGGTESMSDDTSMGEILLVATKGKTRHQGILYVALDAQFPSAAVASEIARAVWGTSQNLEAGGDKGTLYVGGDRVGEWMHMKCPTLVWGSAGAADLHGISSVAEKLAGGELKICDSKTISFPVVPLGNLMSVGSTHDKIGYLARVPVKGGGVREGDPRGVFKWHEISTDIDMRKDDLSLWHAKAEKCCAVYVPPSHYGTEHDAGKASDIRDEKTDIFIQRNIRWTSQKVLVARTNINVLGGRSWAGLSHNDETLKFAFTVWANSIFGFVAYWQQGQRQQSGRSTMQIADTHKLLVPDFSDSRLTARAAEAYQTGNIDQLFTTQLDRANNCGEDPHRQQLNLIAAKILGIPEEHHEETIKRLSQAWAAEPSVATRLKKQSATKC